MTLTPPQLRVPPGTTPDEQKEALKVAFPFMIKGTSREVSPELADMYRYALYARSYWEEQVTLVVNRIRQEMGDAEYAAVRGLPLAQRRIYDRRAYFVDECQIDAIYPAH